MNNVSRAGTILLISAVSLTFGTKGFAAANSGKENGKKFYSYALQPDSLQTSDSASKTAKAPVLGAGGNRLSLEAALAILADLDSVAGEAWRLLGMKKKCTQADTLRAAKAIIGEYLKAGNMFYNARHFELALQCADSAEAYAGKCRALPSGANPMNKHMALICELRAFVFGAKGFLNKDISSDSLAVGWAMDALSYDKFCKNATRIIIDRLGAMASYYWTLACWENDGAQRKILMNKAMRLDAEADAWKKPGHYLEISSKAK